MTKSCKLGLKSGKKASKNLRDNSPFVNHVFCPSNDDGGGDNLGLGLVEAEFVLESIEKVVSVVLSDNCEIIFVPTDSMLFLRVMLMRMDRNL